jgi:antirestriction protein ArdC
VIATAAEFVRLRTSEDPSEYGRAAQEEAPDSVWLELIHDYPEMRRWVAHNKTVPLSILEVLSRDESAAVRSAVADKRKLTTELRRLLSQDSDAGVRARVACNAKCEREILEVLARDPEVIVRSAAADKLKGLSDAL